MRAHRPHNETDVADRGAAASACTEHRVVARDLLPGDYLPPQPALHGTRFRRDGFVVGGSDRDILEPAVLSGRMLVFGPGGTLDSLGVDMPVTVQRALTRRCA